jgi:hypothetical protein
VKKSLIFCLFLFSCSPAQHSIHRGYKPQTPEEKVQVAQQIEEKESPLHVSKDSPAWKPFLFIGLFIIGGCFLSCKPRLLPDAIKKIRSKLDKKN